MTMREKQILARAIGIQKENWGERIFAQSIFAQFMTMREKQILARAIGIQKENWGERNIFLEIINPLNPRFVLFFFNDFLAINRLNHLISP